MKYITTLHERIRDPNICPDFAAAIDKLYKESLELWEKYRMNTETQRALHSYYEKVEEYNEAVKQAKMAEIEKHHIIVATCVTALGLRKHKIR